MRLVYRRMNLTRVLFVIQVLYLGLLHAHILHMHTHAEMFAAKRRALRFLWMMEIYAWIHLFGGAALTPSASAQQSSAWLAFASGGSRWAVLYQFKYHKQRIERDYS